VSALQIEDNLVLRIATRLSTKRLAPPGEKPAAPIAERSGASAERLLRDQPEVLAFVLAGTGSLSPEARATGVFLAEVVFDAFRLAGRDTRGVPPKLLVAALRENREMAVRIGQAHDRFAERYLRNSRTLHQPALIRYVTGVLLEADAHCPHTVPRDELGPLFIVLKSIIDVLDIDAEAALAGEPTTVPMSESPYAAALSSEPA
jgi:hypothetical protein